MVIDARIPLGVQQWKSADPMEMAGRAMQMQGLAQQGQLQQLKMDELARQRQQDAMLQGLAQQSGGDMRKLAKSLYDRGLVTQAMGIEDKLAARDKAAADASKTRADAGKAQFGLLRDGMAFLSRSPSDEAIVGTLGGMVRAGAIDPNMAEQFAGDLLRMPQADRARALAEAARTPEQLAAIYAPKVERIDNGQTIQFRDVNPMTAGQQDPVQRVMTPGEVAADRRGAQSNAISAGNLQVARDRLAFDQQNPRITNVVDTSAGLVGVDARGNTRMLGAPGGMGPAGSAAAPGGLPGVGGGAGPAMPLQGQGGPVPQAAGALPTGAGPAQPGQQQVGQPAAPGFLTKQQQAAQEAAGKASQRRQDALMGAETVMTAVDRALDATSNLTAGAIGAVGAMIPGTPAYNLNATLDTLKANLSFDRLQQMREASATGGALGSVTEKELELLSSTIASLKQGQDPKQLQRNLQDVKARYGRIIGNLQRIEAGDTSVPQAPGTRPGGAGTAMPPAGMAPAPAAPAYSGPVARVSGRIGGGPVSEGGAGQPAPQQVAQRQSAGFTESRVAKWPMPSQVPVGTEIDLPDGRTMVNTGRAWEQKR